MLRGVRDSERKLDAAQRIAHVGWWERDFVNKRVSLSDEAQRIFGVEPVDAAAMAGSLGQSDPSRGPGASGGGCGGRHARRPALRRRVPGHSP
jgi:hypothetical protein